MRRRWWFNGWMISVMLALFMLSTGTIISAAQQKMSPVNSRAAKTKGKAKVADSTLLIRLAPGIKMTGAKKLLHDRGLKVKKFFTNLSRAKGQIYLSVQSLKKDTDVLSAQEVQALTTLPEIDSADLNYEIHLFEHNPYKRDTVELNAIVPPTVLVPQAVPTLVPSDPRYPELWGMQNMEMEAAWDIETGSQEVVVFVIDTGIDTDHPDLLSNLWSNPGEIPSNGIDDDSNGYIDDVHGIDTFNGDSDPEDDYGHGTHVSGTIGAQADNAIGVAGVNWEVNIGACKFLGTNGGSTEGAVQCFDYILGLKNAGVNVVATNNSWGGGGFSQVLHDAIAANIEAGVMPVIAAGNYTENNDSDPHYPCAYSFSGVQGDSLCVAAIDSSNNLAGFSNYGPTSVDLAAPGVNILSTVPDFVDASGYMMSGGTSMASPHVTGLAALLSANKTDSSLNEIREAILCGTVPTASLDGKVVTDGRANAYNSLQWTCSFPSVTITEPENLSSVSDPVTIKAVASSSSGIKEVEFFVDDVFLSVDTELDLDSKYSATLTVSEASLGQHTIKVVATDNDDISASTQVKVYVVDDCSDKQALILDLGSTNSSCDAITSALAQNNIKPVHQSSIGSNINPEIYPLTFICLGYYSSNHVLTDAESASLSTYLDNGGMLYMEGGDTWAYDSVLSIHGYFGINGMDDGGPDLATLYGLSGSLAQGLSFTTSGENAWVDHLEAVNGGVPVWENSSPVYIAGVSNETATYRTVGCSFEFGNIPDEATQAQVMAAYLSFFDYVSDGSDCPDSDVIDFEEAITEVEGKIPDGYKGLNWGEDCHALDPVNYEGGILNPSGFVNGIISGQYVLANPGAETCVITSSSGSVAFDGGYFTAGWIDGMELTVNGYNGGVPTGSVVATVDSTGPTWVSLSTLGTVDRLEISGWDSSMGWTEFFALDDLKIQNDPTYTVTPYAGTGGYIDPEDSQIVNSRETVEFIVTPDICYSIDTVEGCCGTLSGNIYTTGEITGDCTVTASFVINSYTVTPIAGNGGTISPNTPQSVDCGNTTNFTVTPSTGYSIDTVEGCGGTLSGNTYTTGAITADCEVTASFVINMYEVTPLAGEGGSISPDTQQIVDYGDITSFTVTPDTGYSIDTVEGCGGSLDVSTGTYTTEAITGDCEVTATFVIKTYMVTPSAGEHGNISPDSEQAVNYGNTASFTLTPGTGYITDKVEGCNGSLSANTYTIAPASADCTVTASFRESSDSDGDGIDDEWEIQYFSSLSIADAASDYDHDGYTDLQEYLNALDGETDPKDALYDPTVRNAPRGTGWSMKGAALQAVYMLLLKK